MGLNTAIPVRFSEAVAKRLAAVSAKTGLGVSALVRRAVEIYLAEIEKSGRIEFDLSGGPGQKPLYNRAAPPPGARHEVHADAPSVALNERASSAPDAAAARLSKKAASK